MLETGIYIRAQIGGRWQSIDIGDPLLDAEQLLRWLATLTDDQVLKTIRIVREVDATTGVK